MKPAILIIFRKNPGVLGEPGNVFYFLKYQAMAIIITATRIIQELIVHVTMAEKSRIMRARAVRMSSFEGDFMAPFCF